MLDLVNLTAVFSWVWAFDDPFDVIALLNAYRPFDLSDDFMALGLNAVLLLWDLNGLDLIFADLDDLNNLLRDIVWHLDDFDLLLTNDLSLDARVWAYDHHDSLSAWLALSWHDFPLWDYIDVVGLRRLARLDAFRVLVSHINWRHVYHSSTWAAAGVSRVGVLSLHLDF